MPFTISYACGGILGAKKERKKTKQNYNKNAKCLHNVYKMLRFTFVCLYVSLTMAASSTRDKCRWGRELLTVVDLY